MRNRWCYGFEDATVVEENGTIIRNDITVTMNRETVADLFRVRGLEAGEWTANTVDSTDGTTRLRYFEPKTSFNAVLQVVETESPKYDRYIVVKKSYMSSNVKRMASYPNVELFYEHELSFDITRHVLQPKFTAVTLPQRVDVSKWPVMCATDPVARRYGFATGQVVMVERADGSVAYRVVRQCRRD